MVRCLPEQSILAERAAALATVAERDFSYALWTTRLAEENRPMVQQASEMMKLTVVATRQMV